MQEKQNTESNEQNAVSSGDELFIQLWTFSQLYNTHLITGWK